MRAKGFSANGCQNGARSGRALVACALIAGFLLQPVLSYLVTPIVAHGGSGEQIVICTLKGSRLVTLDLPALADSDHTEHCAALKLYQLASAVQISEPPVCPVLSLYSVEMQDQTADHPHRTLHFSAYSTRAPPAV